MLRLSTLLAPYVPTFQTSNQCRTTVLTSPRLTLSVVLLESGCNGPVVIDAADIDVYVAAAALTHQLPGTLCIKRKDDIFDCHCLVTATMVECIVKLHCMTGYDSNSSFYGNTKKSVF